jgi:Ca2+-binding EF-hand superfamily protein
MLTTLQRQRFTRLFRLYDTDNDGYVTHDDVECIATSMARAAGLADDSAALACLKERYGAIWKAVAAMDRDGDGRVTLAEWLAVREAIVGTQNLSDEFIRQIVRETFDLFDADADGQITTSEYVAWLRANHVGEEQAKAAFFRLDYNGDGVISRDEMTYAALDFFFGDNPGTAGHALFGAPE